MAIACDGTMQGVTLRLKWWWLKAEKSDAGMEEREGDSETNDEETRLENDKKRRYDK
jgi:hypothetical protein